MKMLCLRLANANIFVWVLVAAITSSAIASAQTPSHVGSPPSAETKKGLCIVARADGAYLQRLQLVNAHWFYTWGARLPASGKSAGIEFVPMIWGWHDSPEHEQAISTLVVSNSNHKFSTLLGFNEPDGKGQANLTVQQALDAWPKLMEIGTRLGSPAAIHADDKWMKDFMQGVTERNLRVDFVTIHWYGGVKPEELLDYVDRIHDIYKRPVWITEFCPADWGAGHGKRPNRFTVQQVQDFMRAVIPALQSRNYVERFSWFSSRPESETMGISSLFKDDGTPTDLGKLYATF